MTEVGPDEPLTERRMARQLRITLIALAVLVFGVGGAAAFIPIGGAVIGSGRVGVESRVKRVAHPVGGTIAAILVRDGQHVRAGDPLIRLDDTVSGVDADLSLLSVDQMLAQRARLEAEQLGRPNLIFPAALTAPAGAGERQAQARLAIENERRMFAIRQAEGNGLRAQLRARIDSYRQQIGGYSGQIASYRRQERLIAPERRGVRELWEKDLVTISRMNELERTQVSFEGNIASLNAQIAETGARITEAQQQLIQLEQSRRAEAGTQLAALNAALNQQQVRQASAGDLQDRAIIRAPYSGVVDKLAFSTVGGVVRAAEPIMEIVPDADRLVVEAMVSPTDIDQVRAGQQARIRFSAFSATSTPEIAGRVVRVAPDSTVNPELQREFYSVRVEIDAAELSRERQMRLVPGMPAEVFIETPGRSLLSFLTKPLRDQFARAFRAD